MKNILSSVANFISEEEGASAVEYGILVAAIAAVIIGVTLAVGSQVNNAFAKVCRALATNIASGAIACPS